MLLQLQAAQERAQAAYEAERISRENEVMEEYRFDGDESPLISWERWCLENGQRAGVGHLNGHLGQVDVEGAAASGTGEK